jgi:hypothetical protein
MASPPSAQPPRTMLDAQLSFKRWDTISEICKELIKWVSLVLIAYLGYRSIEVLAGKSTFADIGLRVIGNLKVSDGVLFFLTGSGWAYGLGQRSLRRKHIERTVPLKNELERVIDKNRSSSDLTQKGTTPPQKGKR